MSEIKLQTKKGFLNQGAYAKRGATITADEFRAAELHRLGLVEDYEVKQAPEPENKKAPEPQNKAASKSKAKAE